MELYFLGTGAGLPSRERNVTAIALNLLAECGAYWMFDCGEGTQHQILRSPVKLSKTDKLFVTHLHGDHIFGIPGLLSSRSHQGGESPLTLYGPRGIGDFVRHTMDISGSHINYELRIQEIQDEGVLFEDEQFTVTAARLQHRGECFGYRIAEHDRPGTLLTDKLKAMGIPSGPIYGQIKRGGNVQLPDGRTIQGEDFIGPAIPGRVVTILGDTIPCDASVRLAREADVLVHEATFSATQQELAHAYAHSTAEDAARIAQSANARTLILTHLSARYQHEDLNHLLSEAQRLHPDVYLAEDFWSFSVERGS